AIGLKATPITTVKGHVISVVTLLPALDDFIATLGERADKCFRIAIVSLFDLAIGAAAVGSVLFWVPLAFFKSGDDAVTTFIGLTTRPDDWTFPPGLNLAVRGAAIIAIIVAVVAGFVSGDESVSTSHC